MLEFLVALQDQINIFGFFFQKQSLQVKHEKYNEFTLPTFALHAPKNAKFENFWLQILVSTPHITHANKTIDYRDFYSRELIKLQ
jgi:hypothetical protein